MFGLTWFQVQQKEEISYEGCEDCEDRIVDSNTLGRCWYPSANLP